MDELQTTRSEREQRRLLLLSGIPASGKSSLGRYLASECGVLHVDAEEPGELLFNGLREAWNELFLSGSAKALVDAVSSSSASVVLDWGFPPPCLPQVRAMRAAGFELWWLDGDHDAAHQLYRARPDKNSEPAWQRQMRAIEQSWPQIEELFDGRVLETVLPGPRIKPLIETATCMGFTPGSS